MILTVSPPPSHCEVPPLLLALVVLSKQSFSPDCHRWSPGPQCWPPMGGWVGPVVIRAISLPSALLLGMPSAKPRQWTNVDQCQWSRQCWSSLITAIKRHTFPTDTEKNPKNVYDDGNGSFSLYCSDEPEHDDSHKDALTCHLLWP